MGYGLGVLCEAWRGVLHNFTINAVDILVIDFYALQVQLTVKGKTTPDSYTPIPKSSCAQNVVVLK
jgi:hypothetical protein